MSSLSQNPKRNFSRLGSLVHVVPATESDAFLQAAQLLTDMSTRATSGHKRRRGNGGSSHIVIIGPWQPKVLDLSSDSSSSSTSSLHRESIGMPSPPSTPTKLGGIAAPLIELPTPPTDWIAYSAPSDSDEELANITYSDCGSSAPSPPRQPVVVQPLDVKMLLQQARSPSPMHDATWTRKLLQNLQLRGSPEPFRPRLPPRMIPLPVPFQQTLVRPPSPEFRTTTPVIGFPRTVPSSGTTLVADDYDSEPRRTVAQVQAEADLFTDAQQVCSACDAGNDRMFYLMPCRDLVCATCFSSSLAAVSVTQGASKCPACMERVATFEFCKPGHTVAVRGPRRRRAQPLTDVDARNGIVAHTVVMRIDNVAWDIEPTLVEKFLPPGTLPAGHPQPIHICIDRQDGRTKDYMYIEVASQAAARRVLQTRQNSFMPGGRVTGGRKRAVTITQVTHQELLTELRPGSKAELNSLLELCEATLSTPPPHLRMDSSGRGRLHASVAHNGKVHYLKYRHAPYHVLISLMCKMSGRDSPAYWDLFRVASGAIAALATSLESNRIDIPGDRALLARLTDLFDTCFRTRPRVSWA